MQSFVTGLVVWKRSTPFAQKAPKKEIQTYFGQLWKYGKPMLRTGLRFS